MALHERPEELRPMDDADYVTQVKDAEIARLRSALEAAERERAIHEKSWHKLMVRIAEVRGEDDPEACDTAGDEYDPWVALDKIEAMTGDGAALGGAMSALAAARAEAGALLTQKDGVYQERDRLVALVAAMAQAAGMRVGLGRHVGEPWDEDWRTIVFVDLPTGQASWHIHDSEVSMFYWLPTYPGIWDGHTTEEKYQRCEAAARALAAGGGKHGG